MAKQQIKTEAQVTNVLILNADEIEALSEGVSHDTRLAVDGDLARLHPGLVLPDPDVAAAADSGVLQTRWLLVFVLPRFLGGRSREVPWGISLTFLAIVVCYPWVIPWGQLFGA
jgi:hypothetical protein